MPRKTIFLAVVLAATVGFIFAHTGAVRAQDGEPLSPRNANYDIKVRLDPDGKMLTGTSVLSWRNDRRLPAGELWFHLYWNGWKNNRSTWMREGAMSARRRTSNIRNDAWSYIRVKSMRVLADGPFREADLTDALRYERPDDGNPDDQTVLVVTLPRAVRRGEAIRIEMEFEAKIPRTFARTGYRGSYFFFAHWFPKLGVYQDDGTWNCHQYHANTEYFSDYGVYDVEMTVPTGWKLGATGREVSVTDNPDGATTHRYHQADVHAFTWTTSPDYLEARRTFQHPGLPPVEMRLLYQSEHEQQVDRLFNATAAALRYYGEWYGPYPYGHVTIIDPAYGSGAGGMEYPTLFTAGTRNWNPFGGGSPEGVTVHEMGHEFWYGIVGNNEFENAWIDEGLNTFSTSRTMNAAFGDRAYVRRFFKGFLPVMIPEITAPRMTEATGLARYRRAARRDVQSTFTYLYHPNTHASITYSKTGLWLATLENLLGWETFQKIMSTFFERWKFRHPKPEDFFAVANEVSGQDLTWYFDQVYRRSVVFDFAVESVSSRPVKTRGYVDENGAPALLAGGNGKDEEDGENGENGEEETLYETHVVVRRMLDGILPVEVLLKFEDGEEIRETWDAKEQWKRFTVVRPAKLAFAAVDPERKIVLDINYTNNSRRLQPQARLPATKWAMKWMIWLQDLLHTLLIFT